MTKRVWLGQFIAFALLWQVASHGFVSAQTTADTYLQQLKQLSDTAPESVCTARDSLRTLMLEADLDQRDEMFRAYRRFYIRAIATTGPAFSVAMNQYTDDYEKWLTEPKNSGSVEDFLKARPDIAGAGSAWFQCGFSMFDGEGDLYPEPKSDAFLEFADQLEPDLKSYVLFRAQEDRVVVIADACLNLSWEQLRLRLNRWEDFGRNHPKLPETKSEIEPRIRALAMFYFFGSDNTPTFNSQPGRIDDDLVASWRTFAANDRSSRYQPLVSSLLANLAMHNQTLTLEDRPLFEKAGFASEFDQWWAIVQLRQFELQKNAKNHL